MKSPLPKVMTTGFWKALQQRGKASIRAIDDNSLVAEQMQNDMLMRLLRDNADTEYGKRYDFANIKSVEEYKEKVPFSDYDDYAPYIERMLNNETGLITNYPIVHYALSSGSVGVPKHIPVSQEAVDIYTTYGTGLVTGVMNEYYHNTRGRSFKSGHLLLGLDAKPMYTKNGTPKGPISATTLNKVKAFLPIAMATPPEVIMPEAEMDLKYLKSRYALACEDLMGITSSFMTQAVDLMDYIKNNWQMLCDDIRLGIINDKVEMPDDLRAKLQADLKPMPERAYQLDSEFRKGFDDPIIPRIWPQFSFGTAIGTGGFAVYTKKMRKYTGKNIPYEHETYAASEALMAVARRAGDTSFVLLPDSSYYEFVPMDSEDEETTVGIADLEEGKEYEVILTNLSGFYRYRIEDVVRCTGFYNQAPMIEFVYRKNQMLSIAGEKTNEEAVRWSVEKFIKDTGCEIVDYSVYADKSTEPGRYIMLMEADHVVPRDKIPEYRDAIEARLSQANPSYGEKVRTGVLGPTKLEFVQQETYQLYRDMMMAKGVSPNQLKPVRVIDTPMKEAFFFGLLEDYGGSDGDGLG